MTLADPGVSTPQRLDDAAFERLAVVPAEVEWFAYLRNRNARRAYQTDVRDFSRYAGIQQPEAFRRVTRAHVIAWRDHLAQCELGPATIRRKLAALSSLYAYQSDQSAVDGNPVAGVSRPSSATATGEAAPPPAVPRKPARCSRHPIRPP